ncbi:MAG: four helix bundle protein [Firmicutes bacterium]|nr:four helix bundle protein [Bacillota bacterium]
MAQSSPSELVVVTRAKELCSYIMTVTQKSPKHFRFTFVTRLQNLSLNVIENIYRANDIFFGGKHGTKHYAERLEYQRKALTDIRILAYFAFLAMEQQSILPKQYEQISKLSTDCQHLLGAWINSDKKRLPPSGSLL